MNLYFSRDYLAAPTGFDTYQKAGWVTARLQTNPVPGVTVVAPRPLTIAEIATVHAPAYVRAVATDEDEGVWTSVSASNGGAVAAALDAFRLRTNAGSLSSGLHHARWNYEEGFCIFNGLALAARAVIDAGARRVLVLDLDAHFGGGTSSLVRDWPEVTQIDVSVSSFDGYAPTDRHTPYLVTDAADYLPTIAGLLDSAAVVPWDVVLYNAGMDPHEESAIGGLDGITTAMLAERERLVFAWARRQRVPVAFVLAGGYVSEHLSQEALADLHRLTVVAAANGGIITEGDGGDDDTTTGNLERRADRRGSGRTGGREATRHSHWRLDAARILDRSRADAGAGRTLRRQGASLTEVSAAHPAERERH